MPQYLPAEHRLQVLLHCSLVVWSKWTQTSVANFEQNDGMSSLQTKWTIQKRNLVNMLNAIQGKKIVTLIINFRLWLIRYNRTLCLTTWRSLAIPPVYVFSRSIYCSCTPWCITVPLCWTVIILETIITKRENALFITCSSAT